MNGEGRNILALDIAFGPACAVLLRRDGRRFLATGEDDRPHSQAIIPMLQSLLGDAGITWQELDMLACGIGPGSFTGLRIAAATLAGLNASLRLPVIELSSLAISAAQCPDSTALYVIEDARAGLAYVGRYEAGHGLQDDCSMAWSGIGELPPARYTAQQPFTALSGWEYVTPHLARAEAMSELLTVRSAQQADVSGLPHIATPAYLISSQAERHAKAH